MDSVFVFAVALIGVGAWRLLRWVESDDRSEQRSLRATSIVAETAAWVAAGGFMMLARLPDLALLSIWLLASMPVFILIARVSRRVAKGIETTASPSIRAFVRTRFSEAYRRTGQTLGRFRAIVAPTGWSEVRIGFSAMERMLEPMTMVRSYFVLLILVPVIVVVSIIWSLNSGSTFQRGLIGVFVGYNALAWVSLLTAATLITLIIAVLLRVAGLVAVRPDLRGVFVTIAQGIGFGTAAGLVAGALLPFMLGIIPYTATETSISPAMLVDIPAAGGVAGYVVGIVVATAGVFRSAKNLLLRNLLGPLIFGAVIWAMSLADLGPRRILANVLASPLGDVECTEAGLEAHIGDPEWLFRAMWHCGGDVTPVPERALVWVLTVMLVLVVVSFFIRDVHRASAAMREAE